MQRQRKLVTVSITLIYFALGLPCLADDVSTATTGINSQGLGLIAAPTQPQETAANAPAKDLKPPQAFITSDRVVYRAGEPIDVTFSITLPKAGSIVPGFRVENKDGEAVGALMVGGRDFSSAPGKSIDGNQRASAIPASDGEGGSTQWTERIADLRQWFDLDAIGLYSIVFEGRWIDEKGKSHAVESNVIRVQLAGAAGEFEPGGEPVQAREIPLAEIWALDMPGTKPMNRRLGGPDGLTYVAPEGRMVQEILNAINRHEWPRRNALPGFAVGGTGMDALREAHAVLVHGHQPRTQFRAGDQISLVFFSRNYGRRIYLDRVEQFHDTVLISYKTYATWPSATGLDTSHIALISIVVPENNQTRVEIRPVIDWTLDAPPPPSLEHLAHRVCHPFTIDIAK